MAIGLRLTLEFGEPSAPVATQSERGAAGYMRLGLAEFIFMRHAAALV